MTWLSVVPDVLVSVGFFFVPGLLATYLGGLRGITAWATAPLVTVAMVGAVTVAGGWFGFRFGLWPVAIGTVVVAGLAAAVSLPLRARGAESPAADPRSYSLAVVIGAVVAVLVGAVTFLTGVRRPDAINQTWDSVFHYNAVRYIEQTGKASPLTIGTLGQPGGRTSFYPDVWHAMATLLVERTGASIPVAAVVTCLVVAVLVWPLGCLLLARHLFGATGNRAAAAVVITGMLSSLTGAFPWMLTGGYGILWPNALGLALAPAGVALGMSILRISEDDSFGVGRRWFFAAAGAWAITISHPNSALSVALICVFPLVMTVGRFLARRYGRHRPGTTLILLAILALAVVGVLVASRLALIRSVQAVAWPTTETPAHAVVSAVSNATDGQVPELLLATFSIVGIAACFVWRQRRWLVCAELVIVLLYVGSAAIGTPTARLFTGLWFDDSYRIAAILPVVVIPLATMGVLFFADWLSRVPFRASVAVRPALALALPVALGVVVAAGTAAQSVPSNVHTVGSQFNSSGNETLVSRSKLQFLQTVTRLVPASALVADNPFDGTAYLFALSGTRLMFPQMSQSPDPDVTYLAHHLVRLDRDPRACALVRRYDVGYLIVAPDDYLKKWQVVKHGYYAGVARPKPDSGFRLMTAADHGQLGLYKITMCQPGSPSGPVEASGR